jgi:hypothetical protein
MHLQTMGCVVDARICSFNGSTGMNENLSRSQNLYGDVVFKATEAQDFLALVFFMDLLYMGPRFRG